MVATLARPSTTHAHQDDARQFEAGTSPLANPATEVPPIDRAEALLVDLRDTLLLMGSRDRSNVCQNLDILYRAAELRDDMFVEALASEPLQIGPGSRVMDLCDQDDAAQKRAAITHADVVAEHAQAYHAGGIDAGTAMRKKLAEQYGDDLGHAIDRASFALYCHQLYHVGREYPQCCEDDA